MPVSMPDPEDEEFPRLTRRTEEAHGPWWRPRSKWGRIFFGAGALTGIVILFTAGYIFKTYLERDARFRIAGGSNIQATGLTQVTRTDILPVFGEDIGRNIFFVPLSQRRKQLEKIPWVQSATVMRVLPDQLRISVVERTPVALCAPRAADRTGRRQRGPALDVGGVDEQASLFIPGRDRN